MAETPESETTTYADNTHWGIAYLREDLQEIRLQMREDSKELREQIAETNKRVDETNKRIDETNKRIDETNQSLGQRIDETNKIMESRFIWMITTMVALTGILIAVIKL